MCFLFNLKTDYFIHKTGSHTLIGTITTLKFINFAENNNGNEYTYK